MEFLLTLARRDAYFNRGVKHTYYLMELWIFVLLFACGGILLLLKSYFFSAGTRKKKLLHEGYVGAVLLLFASSLIIYFYSSIGVPERVLKELRRTDQEGKLDELPDISQISNNPTLNTEKDEAS